MDAAREYIGARIALALWVSPQEQEGLRAMGYDPDKLICIERFNDETVFLPVQYGYPISLAKKDGGGRKTAIHLYLKTVFLFMRKKRPALWRTW